MRWLINVLKALLVLVALLSLLAYALPERRQIERSRVVAASAERIWPLVIESRRWAAWSPWYAKDPAMTLSYSGPGQRCRRAVVVDQRQPGAWHRAVRVGRAAAPPSATAWCSRDMGSTASGDIRLEPVAGGTRVVWTFETRLGSNPLMRWLGLALDGMLGADFEAGLARLAGLAQQPG